jgi:hypothetical protein
LEIFENLAKHGYVTGNRNRDWGASNGFYPIIRLLQLHHVAMNGRYARLLSLSRRDGRKLIGDADNQHVCWVGAEPWATQIIVENAFPQVRTHAAHSPVQKQVYMAATQHQATRIRILPKRETLAETERLSKVCNKLQANILDRVKLQQSSSKDFPLATWLIFDKQIVCETTKKAACRQRGGALWRAYRLIRPGGPFRLALAQQT